MPIKRKKILAIIPARGGSKGIPLKAIKNFCGKPMIDYTFTETGTFNVNATAKNGTLMDSRNLTISVA